MEAIITFLMALLTIVAAMAVAAKNIAEYKLAKIKLTIEAKQRSTEDTASNSSHFTSKANNLGSLFGLLAIMLSIASLFLTSVTSDTAPLTAGKLASIVESVLVFMSGAYLLTR